MKFRKLLLGLCSLLLLICLLPIGALAANPPYSAGPRKLEGGKRDFKWPVPDQYCMSSCYLDNRNHYSLDIAAPMGSEVVASYAGRVIDVFRGCEHNYGKQAPCCSSWGNYVLLEHVYTLKSGKKITLYSRYAHMYKITVEVGDKILRGQKVGTVGCTGHSTGPHLDYDILYGGTSKKYSVDPYINDLLELPAGVYTRFGACCRSYLSYVQKYYATCVHPGYDGEGRCTACNYLFNWDATKDASQMGYYDVTAVTKAYAVPYTNIQSVELKEGQRVAVSGAVLNGLGESWYAITSEGEAPLYVPKSALEFKIYYPSQMKLTNCTVTNEITLPQASYRLDAQISSRYPLRKVEGYLDGSRYASWSGDGNDTQLSLRGTSLNKKLNFASLAPGEHTLEIFVTDSTDAGRSSVYRATFQIQKAVVTYTITLEGVEDGKLIVPEDKNIGELPKLEKEGHKFLGWFQERGPIVTKDFVPEEDMTLVPKWQPLIYTVLMDDVAVEYTHGTAIEEDAIPEKEGHAFSGWLAEDGREITVGSQVFQNMTLQAQWTPCTYKLQLDAAGGQMEQNEPISVVYGTAYGKLPTPVRSGYLFQGWQLDGQTVNEEMLFLYPTDVTLTAVWKVDPAVIWTWVLVSLAVLGGAGAGVYLWLRKKKLATPV